MKIIVYILQKTKYLLLVFLLLANTSCDRTKTVFNIPNYNLVKVLDREKLGLIDNEFIYYHNFYNNIIYFAIESNDRYGLYTKSLITYDLMKDKLQTILELHRRERIWNFIVHDNSLYYSVEGYLDDTFKVIKESKKLKEILEEGVYYNPYLIPKFYVINNNILYLVNTRKEDIKYSCTILKENNYNIMEKCSNQLLGEVKGYELINNRIKNYHDLYSIVFYNYNTKVFEYVMNSNDKNYQSKNVAADFSLLDGYYFFSERKETGCNNYFIEHATMEKKDILDVNCFYMQEVINDDLLISYVVKEGAHSNIDDFTVALISKKSGDVKYLNLFSNTIDAKNTMFFKRVNDNQVLIIFWSSGNMYLLTI